MFKRVITVFICLVLVSTTVMVKPVKAYNHNPRYSIYLGTKSSGMGYTKRIKFSKKKITVWGAIYSCKKNKVLKYKKRSFKVNSKTQYGSYGYGLYISKKVFMSTVNSYTKKNGKVKTKNGIYIDLSFKNGKVKYALLVS